MEAWKEIISICACGCGRTFSKFDNKHRERRFISGHNNKKKEGTHLRIELVCQFCKKVFIGYPSNSSKKYCSMTCKVKASTGVLLTEDGRISSSGNGYSTIVKRNHPLADTRGRVPIHRLIAYDNGILKDLAQSVHHKDGNKINNNIDNLRALSQGEHLKITNPLSFRWKKL